LHKARRLLGSRDDDLKDFGTAVEIGLIGFLVTGFFLSSAHLDVFYWVLALSPVTLALARKTVSGGRPGNATRTADIPGGSPA
jgi:hypothetical protein